MGHRIQIARSFTFEAAHALPNVPAGHKCARMHGHSFSVTITVTGPVGEKTGWVTDFADLDAVWLPLHKQLDHNCLNDIEGLENPTSEVLAGWIYQRVSFDAPLRLVSIEVSETCRAGCTLIVE